MQSGPSSNSQFDNIELNLSTQSSKARIILKKVFVAENLNNFQVNTGASSNQIKKLTNFLRCNVGKKFVPAYYAKHIKTYQTS